MRRIRASFETKFQVQCAREKGMTTEELEKIVPRHEMQRLELKEGFNVESIESFGGCIYGKILVKA